MTKFKKQKRLDGKLIPIKKRAVSEFQSYTYIKNELKTLNWNVKNPNTDPKGQLYTQHECLGNPELKSMLHKLVPEYVIKLREDTYWVIEAKATSEQIDEAFGEAKDYGRIINDHQFIRAKIVSGVAGHDDDRYLVKTGFWNEKKKEYFIVEYENRELTSLMPPDIVEVLLGQDSHKLKKLEFDEEYFVKIAERINTMLHLSSIKKDKRPSIVASILLSMFGKTEPNYNAEPSIFVNEINTRAKKTLKKQKKGSFFKHIKIELPDEEDAQVEYKKALVSVFFILKKANIKSAMNTDSDILGKFYEVFLKYGNGAKDLGILLTPGQITNFASEILNINHKDIIYDPTCGTGGFLVSAFYQVKEKSTPTQLNNFKRHGIFGIDRQPTVTTLSIINMLFRGDGKNNVINTNCLGRALVSATHGKHPSAKYVSKSKVKKDAQRPVTKVLMNPPFSLKKKGEEEYSFIRHALEQMEDGGLLFSIFPCSGMVKQKGYLKWRKNLLKENTLLSVITLNEDAFYPQSPPPTLCFIIKKGSPHPKGQNVLWIKIQNDGYRKVKGRRLLDAKISNDLDKIKDILKAFLINPSHPISSIPKFQKACPIDFDYGMLELVPEVYLDEVDPTIKELKEGTDQLIRDSIAFLISHHKEDITIFDKVRFKGVKTRRFKNPRYKPFKFDTDLKNITSGDFHAKKELNEGKVPLISCGEFNNGLVGHFDVPSDHQYINTLTIAYNGKPLNTNFHPYKFGAKDDVAVFTNKMGLKPTTLIFIGTILNMQTWKFSYGRKCFKEKLKQQIILLPVDKNGNLDEKYMEKTVTNSPYWKYLEHHLI